MLMPMGTVSDIAYADDDPAPIQDLYTIDGVNYYNTGSESFAESQYQYLKEFDYTIMEQRGYNFTVVFSSSIEGATFEGAIGSTLKVDKVRVTCETKE